MAATASESTVDAQRVRDPLGVIVALLHEEIASPRSELMLTDHFSSTWPSLAPWLWTWPVARSD